MQIRIIPQDDGDFTVWVKKTLSHEGPSRLVADLPQEKLEEHVVSEIARMRAGAVQETFPESV